MNEFSRRQEGEYKKSQLYEEIAYVLDFLPHGKPGARPVTRPGYRVGAYVQVIGRDYFTLLEAVVREGVVLKPFDPVYVGKVFRDQITYIIGRIGYDELTSTAKLELVSVVEKIVINREEWFVQFFNTAQPVTPRMHSLELIPGVGKKYMWQIINEREKSPFKSFEDLQKRTGIPNPSKLLTKRVVEELASEGKYRLFTRAH